jgi:hypothetical protein
LPAGVYALDQLDQIRGIAQAGGKIRGGEFRLGHAFQE